jgi:hypothetical protein
MIDYTTNWSLHFRKSSFVDHIGITKFKIKRLDFHRSRIFQKNPKRKNENIKLRDIFSQKRHLF